MAEMPTERPMLKCPRCKTNAHVEASNYRDEGAYFCTGCNEWFGRKAHPKSPAERQQPAKEAR